MNKRYRFYLGLMVAVLLAACAPLRDSGEFAFFQMADTQFGFFNQDKEFSRETENFEKAVEAVNRLKPAFVIVCGDLINKPGDSVQIAEYKRISSLIDPSIKLYNVPGNHDVENTPTSGSIKLYQEHFGDDRYTFQSGSVFGIVLNSSLMKDPAKAPEETAAQDAWLRSALEEAGSLGKEHIMVFMHHPLFLAADDEPDEYFNIDQPRRKMYLDLFKQHGVKHIFVGHYHRNAWGRSGDLEMITTGPVGRPLGQDSSGFRIVNVGKSAVSHQYYSLDSLPQSLNLKNLK